MKPSIEICSVTYFLEGYRLPTSFQHAVRLLQRPYRPIPKADYERLITFTDANKSDVISDKNGDFFTFGHADQGYAIMLIRDRSKLTPIT